MGAHDIAAGVHTQTRRRALADDVTRAGFARVPPEALACDPRSDEFSSFRRLWQDLPVDEELREHRKSRYRRYGRVRVQLDESGSRLTVLPHATFRQDGIELWRGRDRRFAPISEETLESETMRTLVGFDASLASAITGTDDWEVGLHQIRMVASPESAGPPTPEGRHRDGHQFVGMHLVGRERCEGGLSTVYTESDQSSSFTLHDPLDSLFVDDRRVTHEVSPITTATDRPAVRDMLLVDLNPWVVSE